jgi:hypothetical protein
VESGDSKASSGDLKLATGASSSGVAGSISVLVGRGKGNGGTLSIGAGFSEGSDGGKVSIVSGGTEKGKSGSISIASATAGTAGVSGDISLETGSASTQNSGDIMMRTGASTTGSGGSITLEVGSGKAAAEGGKIAITAGTSASGPGGSITLKTGGSKGASSGAFQLKTAKAGTSGQSGGFEISTGTSPSENSGDVSLTTGDGGSTAGAIRLTVGKSRGGKGSAVVLAAGATSTGEGGGDVQLVSGAAAGGSTGSAVMMRTAVFLGLVAVAAAASLRAPEDELAKEMTHDLEMNFNKIAPFGKEDTAKELQDHAAKTQDTLVDAVENAEVAEIKRAVFRALTRLRAATIKEFDTIARLETQAIDAYNDAHHYRAENPLTHLHEDEAPVETDKLKSFH